VPASTLMPPPPVSESTPALLSVTFAERDISPERD
jgi:hypothetical protein